MQQDCEPGQGQESEEDCRTLRESIAQFGPPQDFASLGLPGPEFAADDEQLVHKNIFTKDDNGNYSLRFRAKADNFTYNSRYEAGEVIKNGSEEVLVVRGQFGEKFEKKSGGWYIRTIGYVKDEKGYRQFLVDLTTLNNPLIQSRISTTVLTTLTGGN